MMKWLYFYSNWEFMVELLIVLGLSVGIMAGFFGVGGGTLIVPVLMMYGYSIQEAIGISIIQMLFSSLWGSYINFKASRIDFNQIWFLGFGALLGGGLSPIVVLHSSAEFLEFMFLIFVSFALLKFFYTPLKRDVKENYNKTLLFIVGFIAALASASVGIGGAILVTPFLHSFLGYDLKKATAISLFFITFNAIAGSVSWILSGALLYKEGLIVGTISLVGVSLGLYLAHKVSVKTFKLLLLGLYVWVFSYFVMRLFF
jgi:uncharacterized protein